MLESLLNKVADLMVCNFISTSYKRDLNSCKNCKIFTNSFFYRIPPVAASVSLRKYLFNDGHLLTSLLNQKQIIFDGFYENGL